MPRRPDLEKRAQLLSDLVAVCAAEGVGRRSLRDIAERLGTSSRMLVHYFGSREAMLLAVVEAAEQRQAEILDQVHGSPTDEVERLWSGLSEPGMWPLERLFFECYARGANGEAPFDALIPGVVDSWLDGHRVRRPDDDPAIGRLALAVVRGLLLDLVATGHRAGTTRAMARFLDMLGRTDVQARTTPDGTKEQSDDAAR